VNFDRDVPKPERFVDVRKIKEGEVCGSCRQGRLTMRKALRLGHISQLGTMYSRVLRANFASRNGKSEPLLLSSCGIDMMRLFAAIVEQHSDEKGIAWPDSIAPFAATLVSLPGVESRAREIYEKFLQAGLDLLWDDRDAPAGAKFADADLIGIPIRLLISSRTGEKLEWKERRADITELVSAEEAIRRLETS
jgi:prolyl-tRNA synthetase